MANVTANPDSGYYFTTEESRALFFDSASQNEILAHYFGPGKIYIQFLGNFNVDQQTGTVSEIYYYDENLTFISHQIPTQGLDDASVIYSYLSADNFPGLFEYLLGDDDYFVLSNEADSINSYSGNDEIYGLSGNDNFWGGPGNDFIDGGNDNDTIDGQSNDDYLKGGAGNDTLIGGSGTDTAIYASSFSNYSVTYNGGSSYTIIDNSGGPSNEGTDNLSEIEYANFNSIDYLLKPYLTIPVEGNTLDLLLLTKEQQIAATYVAFFGRGADADGFNFWVDEFNFGLNFLGKTPAELFADVASSFGISDEAKSLYSFLQDPFGASPTEIGDFLDTVYLNMFNRAPDNDGKNYWTEQINATLDDGQFVGSVLINIMSGAQNTNAGQDITTLMSKVAVSMEYVDEQILYGTEWTWADDLNEAVALLDDVTDAPQTLLLGLSEAHELVLADYLFG